MRDDLAVGAEPVYARVEGLQEKLRSASGARWCDRLEGAMRRGATSGEILTDIAVVLDDLKAEDWLTSDLRWEVGRLLDDVDQLLQPRRSVWNPQLSRYERPDANERPPNEAGSARLQLIGHVSTEGGPLLIVDFNAARGWSGVDGGDYQRVSGGLDAHEDLRGLQVEVLGEPALVWEMPTGTADVWRRSDQSLLLCRPWLEPESRHEELLADLPPNDPLHIGHFRLTSGWLVVVWAAETGSELAQVLPQDGLALDLSVGSAGIMLSLAPGDYDCYHDAVTAGSESALRCFIVRGGTRPA